MMHLLLDILQAPDPSTLETFLGRVPMVFNVVILSPHGFFGQANVLGLPDTGGQVFVIIMLLRTIKLDMYAVFSATYRPIDSIHFCLSFYMLNAIQHKSFLYLQVVYILDQVRALESEMLVRIKKQGLDFTPRILIVSGFSWNRVLLI